MEDLDPMQWTIKKIKFCLVTWSQIMPCGVFQVPSYPREKHYDDSLSRQSRRFKNPNKRPNVMQVDHLTTAVGFQWLLHAGALCVARPVLDRFPNKQIQLNISTEWIFGSIGEQSWCIIIFHIIHSPNFGRGMDGVLGSYRDPGVVRVNWTLFIDNCRT